MVTLDSSAPMDFDGNDGVIYSGAVFGHNGV